MNCSHDFITNFFFKIKNNYIYGCLELNKVLSEKNINEYISKKVEKNSILKSYYIQKNNKVYIKKIDNLNINEHYKIIYINLKNKNKHLREIINTKIKTKVNWFIYVLIDVENNKSLTYIKIDHSYCDGYNLLKIFNNNENNTNFKRIPKNYFSMIYYYLIGTIISVISMLKFCYNFYIFYKENKNEENKNKENKNIETDFIIINGLDINQIKLFTLKHDITINDFLFALMIKTDYIYTEKQRTIKIIIPINTNNTNNTNNILPLFIETNNNDENIILLKKNHNLFNNYKYSLFIPTLSYLVNKFSNVIPIDINIFNSLTNYTDYKFTNIICPLFNVVNTDVANINFLTNIHGNEKTFNIISYKNKINMVISFKKISTNKKKFKDALYKAYNSLMKS